MPPRFAIPEPVRITPAERGSWEWLPDGRLVWRLRVGAPGAVSLNLGFTRYRMPPGGRLLIYSADQKHVVRPFTAADNAEHGELWTPVVPGWDLVIELLLPAAEVAALELELGSVNQGYRGFGLDREPESGSCNMDVACLTAEAPWAQWREVARAVGVISTGGSTFCTGSLLNNTAQDKKMLFMTAYHCGVHASNAASLVVYWNYENSTCRVPGSAQSGQGGNGSLSQFQPARTSGPSLGSDFTLVELAGPPVAAFNHYWAGWDRTPYTAPGGPGNGDHACGPEPAALCAAIHHPNTDEKRITFVETNTATTGYNNPVSPGAGTHVHAYWDPTPIFPPNPGQAIPPQVTEPGSSAHRSTTRRGSRPAPRRPLLLRRHRREPLRLLRQPPGLLGPGGFDPGHARPGLARSARPRPADPRRTSRLQPARDADRPHRHPERRQPDRSLLEPGGGRHELPGPAQRGHLRNGGRVHRSRRDHQHHMASAPPGGTLLRLPDVAVDDLQP